MSDLTIRGRGLSPDDLEVIRQIAERPGQSRRGISLEVCARLGWYQPNGRLWDMACRYLLLRLQDKGLLRLPSPKVRNGKRHPFTLLASRRPPSRRSWGSLGLCDGNGSMAGRWPRFGTSISTAITIWAWVHWWVPMFAT